jgi:anti-sigma regulatory factor (Ser/Thr protein kinase)
MAVHVGDWSHEATFEALPISASQARTFVSGHLVDHRLPHLLDAARVVVSELATNALVHARTAFIVTLAGADQTLLLTVRDGSARLPSRTPTQAMDTSGRGLEIVGMLSLDWGIDQDVAGSKSVWAAFAMRDDQEA